MSRNPLSERLSNTAMLIACLAFVMFILWLVFPESTLAVWLLAISTSITITMFVMSALSYIWFE